jgi:hypothetical protein
MTSPPQLSLAIYTLGTPVSVINITSKRQQQAWQFEQVTAGCSTEFIVTGVDDLSDDSGNMVMILVGI